MTSGASVALALQCGIPLALLVFIGISASSGYFAERDRAFELTLRHSGKLMAAVVIAVAAANAGYAVLVGGGLLQSAALYLGVPVLIAVVLATMDPATSCMRLTLVGVVAALLLATTPV